MFSGVRGAVQQDTAVTTLTLPISGLTIGLGEPSGHEDVRLAEARADDPGLALALVQRLVKSESRVDWRATPVFDIDVVILEVRRRALGDRITSSLPCPGPHCASRMELNFSLGAYLAHHAPNAGPIKRRGWSVAVPNADGWRRLTEDRGPGATFRLPTLDDQMALMNAADPAATLAERCVKHSQANGRTIARVQSALARWAPSLSGPLGGACVDCGAPITTWFEARTYCLQELGQWARFVYEDVSVLAERYHWSERAILSLPSRRRAQYAERARQTAAA
jgi:hypothetical protein